MTFFGKRWNASLREFFFSPREEGGKKCGELSEVCVGKREKKTNCSPPPHPRKRIYYHDRVRSTERDLPGKYSLICSGHPFPGPELKNMQAKILLPPKKNFLNKFKKGFIFLKKIFMGNLRYVALRLGVRLISGPVFQPVCLSAGWRGGRNGFSFQIRGIWKKFWGGGK